MPDSFSSASLCARINWQLALQIIHHIMYQFVAFLQTGRFWYPQRLVFYVRTELLLCRPTPYMASPVLHRALLPLVGCTRSKAVAVSSRSLSVSLALMKYIGKCLLSESL